MRKAIAIVIGCVAIVLIGATFTTLGENIRAPAAIAAIILLVFAAFIAPTD